MLLNKKYNTYNVDKAFDYFTIKAMVIEFIEKTVRQELNRDIGCINLHKIDTCQDKEDVVIVHTNIKTENKKHNRISKLAY
ncbi:MAG: hypothetical protein JO297_19095 [Nitrososphaeraceae archaeon]|nr:hypothetical protein [Nitrososphaeraceae archaeon]